MKIYQMFIQMLKESIIEDAITYVKKLQDDVNSLTQELQALEAKENLERKIDEVYGAEEMKKWGIQVLYTLIFLIFLNK